ncbi:hypothetical protein GOBAR_AA08832 [Gossypium barbadense]|uniref:Uncharacterized protein n=1 Tax=Gossypium barbadense TaxID=3634 RepID=A0A2P5Y8B4_GOSBA|nr:hypothetical protein GOBAR_AA08832 [Gossypium barbadense]
MESKPFGTTRRTRMQGIGIYTNTTTKMQVLNLGRRGQMKINRPQSRPAASSSNVPAFPQFVASSTSTSSATSLIPKPSQLVASSRLACHPPKLFLETFNI